MRFFLTPLLTHLSSFLLQFVELLGELLQLGLIVFSADSLALNLQLLDLPLERIEFFRHGVHLQPEFSGGFIHQVDGFVGEETVGYVSVGKLYGGYQSAILDAYMMVVFVTLFQATEDTDSGRLVRLFYHHDLESALQGFIFFEILLILG